MRFVVQDANATPLQSTDTLVISGQVYRLANAWCHGQAQMNWPENPLAFFMPGSDDALTANGVTGTSPWMVSYLAMFLGWARQTGAVRVNGKRLFEHSAAKLGRTFIDATLHPKRAGLYLGAYHSPVQDANGLITSWDQFVSVRHPPIALAASMSSNATSFTINCAADTVGCVNVPQFDAIWKIDNEFIRTCNRTVSGGTTTYTVCANGRGIWGSTAAAHTTASTVSSEWRTFGTTLAGHTYPNLFVNALALYHDVRGEL